MNKRFQFVIVSGSTCLMIVLMLGTVLERGKAQADSTYKHFSVLSEVIEHIKRDYVEEPEMKSVTLGALTGLLDSMDPYASYLSSDQYKQYLKSKETKQADVGLILSRVRPGYVGVVDSIPGSPADTQGLTTGDVLETINGISTRDMPLAYAELLMHGEQGTSVELSVVRARQGAEAQKVALVRSPIEYPAVSGSIINGDIGYIKIPSLESGKVKEVANRLKDLERQGAKKLVVDLRYNGTGEPAEGIALANLFVDKGLLAYAQGQKFPKKEYQANAANAVEKMPAVVIVNRGTACGAEIAAAAIFDNKRAEVVGERTVGCGYERKAVMLDDGSAVILTVAKYYMPSGKTVQDNGITPSVPILGADLTAADDDEDTPKPTQPRLIQPQPTDDPLLRKAVEVLTVGVEAAKKSTGQSRQATVNTPLQMQPLNIPSPGR